MSDELKPRESVNSKEFRDLLKDVCDKPYRADRVAALIAHINAWGARLADDSPAVKRLVAEIELLQKERRILCEKFGEMTTQIMDLTSEVESLRGASVPAGYKLVPIEPTEEMVTQGFESWPDPFFSKPEEWDAYEEMTGCQKAAHRAKLCWSAMLAASPNPDKEPPCGS